MIALIQRVREASVSVDGNRLSQIGRGSLILLGVFKTDGESDIRKLAAKTVHLRIFADAAGKMNHSLLDTMGEALVVSQVTLAADCRKGRRPSLDAAASGEQARTLYRAYCSALVDLGVDVQTGEFGAMMQVSLVNDGPVTVSLDSQQLN